MMKRNPDWNIDELVDSVWDKIGTAHGFIQLQGVKEKPASEPENYFGKNKDDRRSEETFLWDDEKPHYFPFEIDEISNIHEFSGSHLDESFFSAACYPNCISNSEVLSSHDAVNKDSCPMDEVCNYNAIPENDNMMDLKESCSYSIEKDTQPANYAEIVQDNQKDSYENQMFIESPDFDDFEDVNMMFRDRDGQKQVERADETSWFPTSYDIRKHPEVSCTSGLSSSCSDHEMGNDSLGQHCTNSTELFAKFSMPSPINQSRSQFDGDWMDNHAEEMDSPMQNMGSSSISETMKLQECLYEGSHAPFVLPETHGGFLYSDINPSNLSLNINWNFPSTQAYMTSYISGNELLGMTNRPTHSQVLSNENCCQSFSSKELKQPELTPERGITFDKQVYQKAMIPTPLTQGKSLVNQSSVQHNSQEVKRFAVLPEGGTDSFGAQEKLFVTAVSTYDIPIEATGFHQLSNAMDQLDIRTKLCIRDSFYRFASSAKKRCNSINHNKEGTCTLSQMEESSNRYSPEIRSAAASTTNLVDQFIANLLFQRAKGPPTSS